MNSRNRGLRLRHLVLLVGAGVLALPAVAEVMTVPKGAAEGPTPPPNVKGYSVEGRAITDYPAEIPIGTTETVHHGRLRVQCWQEGRKIIDRTNLRALSLNSATQRGSITFKPVDDDQPSVSILPFADGLCLVEPIDGEG